ncbi:MAG: hypothetical protein P4L53_23340 [Candidatus Obscuribacterales bacterium]|nr:hypothetical protein [Candidatus Obscuribacterales bacterium]
MAEFDSEFLEPRGREYVQKQFSTIRALHTIALYDEAALKQWIAQVERVLHDFESMGFSHDWG